MHTTDDVLDLSEVSQWCPVQRNVVTFPLAARYDLSHAHDALRPAWMLTVEERRTWRAVVPIVCFMYVRMHHVDRVKRQLGGEQQIPEDPVNLDEFLSASARGEDQWWLTKHAEWYDDWRGRLESRMISRSPLHPLHISPWRHGSTSHGGLMHVGTVICPLLMP
ncbi:hypothetical protein PIB30_078501 [Stylosanthes scabra]|uniref:Aminotransferase-like plant mobile domain-containing protein n=1 Tax=Stylosanthes scabra TaxID=79078 RepID=A0ABU6URP5_9FABA|nr:hypothetical protein [Stylosanthes scabra]